MCADKNSDEIRTLSYLLSRSGEKEPEKCAEGLLSEYGDFRSVINADAEALVKYNKISERSAALLKLIPEVAKLRASDGKNKLRLNCAENAMKFFRGMFIGITSERVAIATVSEKFAVISSRFISYGDLSAVSVSAETIAIAALNDNAHTIFIAHNHPSGENAPSADDVDTTRRLADALLKIGIYICDHIIISPDSEVSMRQLGYDFSECPSGYKF